MEEPDATVYRYFKVSYDKDSYVRSARLRFSINKTWLKTNDIDPYKVSMYIIISICCLLASGSTKSQLISLIISICCLLASTSHLAEKTVLKRKRNINA